MAVKPTWFSTRSVSTEIAVALAALTVAALTLIACGTDGDTESSVSGPTTMQLGQPIERSEIGGLPDDVADPDRPSPPESPEPESTVAGPEPQDEGDDEAVPGRCEFEWLTNDLTGNRGGALPSGRLQVVVYYDGAASSPQLRIGLTGGDWITVGGERAGGEIDGWGVEVETREYDLLGCAPNGTFEVTGVEANGVVDGMAFGLLWRDESGGYHMVKSANPPGDGPTTANFVGMWPLGFSWESFEERTPAITDPFGRETARGLIIGAALLPNGHHDLP